MAFGTGSRSFGSNAILYSFKVKTKDLPAPVFEVSQKGEDGKYHLIMDENGKPKRVTRVSGDLVDARIKSYDYQGDTIKSLGLTLQDGNDVYFVSVGFTFLGRNLFNSCLNLTSFDDIEIGLYQSRPKPDSVNKNGFPSVALRQHNELVKGAFDSKKDLPPVKKVKLKGKDVTDTGELDLWFEAKLNEWCKKVNVAAHSNPRTTTDETTTGQETDGNTDNTHNNTEEDPPPPF